jgi:serine/threonine protein kinase
LAPHFPQLEILELLGYGGMGVVYRARQRTLDRIVALKLLSVGPDAGADFTDRFTREARALASLSHPSIVTVFDFGQAGPHYFLSMEFVDGANLRDVIAAGKLAPREALELVSQLCDALQYAHDEGVVHRDIKPENVLLDRRGRVKIADFGLARMLGQAPNDPRLTGTRQAMGTAHYMAPEQIEHPLEVDHRADIYSMGVVFYELLTGELPIGRFAPPSRKVEVDVRVDEIVLRTLEKEPGLRYQKAGEVKTDVDHISTAAVSPPPPPPPRAQPPRQPVWPWVLAAVVVMAFAGVAAMVFFLGMSRSRPIPLPAPSTVEISSTEATRGNTPLMRAVERGSISGVEALIETGVDVNARGFNQNTALIVAAQQGHLEIIEMLLDQGADSRAAGISGSPVTAATSARHTRAVQRLLEAGGDPDAQNAHGATALMMASEYCEAGLVELLIGHHAALDTQNAFGNTALIQATEANCADAVRQLLAAGADVNVKGFGGTALMLAAGGGREEILQMLRTAAAE